VRKPRRFCPGVRGDICAICCGQEREQTIHCPLDCQYLIEARRHEEPPIADPATFPHQDIRVTEEFLVKNEPVLIWIGMHVLSAAVETPDAADSDIKDALDGLVRTYRTLQSGLVYESRPTNPVASAIFEHVQASVDEMWKHERERSGVTTIRDADILGVLSFLQRLEIQHNNGRRLGRAFVHFLRSQFPQAQPAEQSPSVIV